MLMLSVYVYAISICAGLTALCNFYVYATEHVNVVKAYPCMTNAMHTNYKEYFLFHYNYIDI